MKWRAGAVYRMREDTRLAVITRVDADRLSGRILEIGAALSDEALKAAEAHRWTLEGNSKSHPVYDLVEMVRPGRT